jgi:hypothetical protein
MSDCREPASPKPALFASSHFFNLEKSCYTRVPQESNNRVDPSPEVSNRA